LGSGADNYHLYTPAIRTLRLMRDTLSDGRGCPFPRLRNLYVYYSGIAGSDAFSTLLDGSDALLH
jgi:hypothetical protein